MHSQQVYAEQSGIGKYEVQVHRVQDELEMRFCDNLPGEEPSVQSTVNQAMLLEPPSFASMDGYCKTMLLGLGTASELPQLGWKALVIGLGGGVLPRFLVKSFPEASVEVVELDPVVVKVAEKHFGCSGIGLDGHGMERLQLHAADGKQFIIEHPDEQLSLIHI
eukprot:TRINITY_DN52314_c0_g1_i1.p1 TRINITY_DN52314_c0_g1~~TRINITY_DN52314_c0_g1_i1.p1  ORF type:complete len:164 (+),score=62.85 TRINITY_DN52314_c0_g1_i1:148-639(+)